MMNYLFHTYTSNNPSGVVINLGWYALAECIIVGTNPGDALLRWCGVRIDRTKERKPYTPRKYVPPDTSVEQKVYEIYKNNPSLQNKEIAKMVGRSSTYVSQRLNKIGIRRNRWDGHEKKGGQV